MTKVSTSTATISQPLQEEELQLSSSSYYNPRCLQLYIPAEIEHCDSSKTIAKCINAKMIQSKNTGVSYKTRLQSLLSLFTDVMIKFL